MRYRQHKNAQFAYQKMYSAAATKNERESRRIQQCGAQQLKPF
jgi:hypothetical protein